LRPFSPKNILAQHLLICLLAVTALLVGGVATAWRRHVGATPIEPHVHAP